MILVLDGGRGRDRTGTGTMGTLLIMVNKYRGWRWEKSNDVCLRGFEKDSENSLGTGRNTKAMTIFSVLAPIIESTSTNV